MPGLLTPGIDRPSGFQPQEDEAMADTGSRMPITSEGKGELRRSAIAPWRPFEGLRREVDRLFEDFDRGAWHLPFRRSLFDLEPFWRRDGGVSASPATDVIETDKAYEIAVELPGLEEKDLDVKLSDGGLMISGEKQSGRKEEAEDYCLHERRFGAFQRSFALPDDIDPAAIEARFARGVLTVVLPKKPEPQRQARKITIKTA